jgi:hypothetical protein
MENGNDKQEPSGEDSDLGRDMLSQDPMELAWHFQKMFRDFNRGHRKNLHAFLAGAVKTKKAFLCDPESYGVLRFVVCVIRGQRAVHRPRRSHGNCGD